MKQKIVSRILLSLLGTVCSLLLKLDGFLLIGALFHMFLFRSICNILEESSSLQQAGKGSKKGIYATYALSFVVPLFGASIAFFTHIMYAAICAILATFILIPLWLSHHRKEKSSSETQTQTESQFKEKVRPVMILAVLGNIGLLLSNSLLIKFGMGKSSLVILAVALIFNFVLATIIYRASIHRLIFLSDMSKWKAGILSYCVYLFPLFGLFFFLGLFKNKENWRLSLRLRNSAAYAVMVGFLMASLYAPFQRGLATNNIVYNALFYYQVQPTLKYLSNLGFEFHALVGFREKVIHLCPDQKNRSSCVFNQLQQKIQKKGMTAPGMVLAVATVSLLESKMESKTKQKPLDFISRLIKITRMTCDRAGVFEQAVPFGIGLVAGDGEIAILTILDVFLTASTIHKVEENLIKILKSTPKNKLSRELASLHREFDDFKETKCFQYHSSVYRLWPIIMN